MVNIRCAAQEAVAAYSSVIALGGDYTYPLSTLGAQVSTFFLPNCTSYHLGTSTISPNQSVVSENFVNLYTQWRENGPGTHVVITQSRVEPVSNESAICWLTYRVSPVSVDVEGWEWTVVYGYRLLDDGPDKGRNAGWEFVVGDEEHTEYAKRFPS